jgi:hypothetical protein
LLQTNGLYEFSGKKLDCVLYPNPNNGLFTLDYTGNKIERLSVSVLDIKGSVVNSTDWQVNAGLNRKTLSLQDLPKGTYLVRLSSATGTVSIKTIIH